MPATVTLSWATFTDLGRAIDAGEGHVSPRPRQPPRHPQHQQAALARARLDVGRASQRQVAVLLLIACKHAEVIEALYA
jgi:hypothetical protein